ncbi:unnamed protein product [Protopolystoma xenopodis]|uniref:Uncharacterized protein n=1 Tax=Protopolystoma xenopodis TaxID=117903 RepID=A0A3S5CHV6_9PLAT|nr:unnamed protein product [Protopolystoma xenopodis]
MDELVTYVSSEIPSEFSISSTLYFSQQIVLFFELLLSSPTGIRDSLRNCLIRISPAASLSPVPVGKPPEDSQVSCVSQSSLDLEPDICYLVDADLIARSKTNSSQHSDSFQNGSPKVSNSKRICDDYPLCISYLVRGESFERYFNYIIKNIFFSE